jgi:hypothetical protein
MLCEKSPHKKVADIQADHIAPFCRKSHRAQQHHPWVAVVADDAMVTGKGESGTLSLGACGFPANSFCVSIDGLFKQVQVGFNSPHSRNCRPPFAYSIVRIGKKLKGTRL